MNPIRRLRALAGLTQVDMAWRAGTSQPTVAAYESGSKSPTARTLERIAAALAFSVVYEFVPEMTREERCSLALHRAIADKLIEDPEGVIARARRNLIRMREQNPQAAALLAEWSTLLDLSPERLAANMVDPRPDARELRQVTPFAGVLTPEERSEVYRRFAAETRSIERIRPTLSRAGFDRGGKGWGINPLGKGPAAA